MIPIRSILFAWACTALVWGCAKTGQESAQPVRTPTESTSTAVADIASLDCVDVVFHSDAEHVLYLAELSYRMDEAESDEMPSLEQDFFCAFPDRFDTIQRFLGNMESVEGYSGYVGQRFDDTLHRFTFLKTIPKDDYYRKFVRMSIGGNWEADQISNTFGFLGKLFHDIPNAGRVLAEFTDDEIRSVFRFAFDGPHPDHPEHHRKFDLLQKRLEPFDPRLSRLMSEAFLQLLAEDDGHGH